MATNAVIRVWGPRLLVFMVCGCSADVDTGEQPVSDFPTCGEPGALLELALRTLDDDDVVMTYDEAASTTGIVVNIGRFAWLVGDATVEMQIDVQTPVGTVERHNASWRRGADLPRFAMRTIDNGRYQVAVTNWVIDGREIDGVTVGQSMELLGVRSSGGELAGNCENGGLSLGTDGPDELQGTDGNDAIYGFRGPDVLFGHECGDMLWGGRGNDTLWGNWGNDQLFGGPGYDACRGGAGVDTFSSCETITQ